MSGFVAGLHMYEYEVVLLQGVDGSLGLTLIVGVGQTCCAFYLDDTQSSIVADAADKVDGRDDGTRLHLRILGHQRLHRGPIAATPGPDAVGLALAALCPLDVEWVLGQQFLRFQDQFVQEVGCFFRGER